MLFWCGNEIPDFFFTVPQKRKSVVRRNTGKGLLRKEANLRTELEKQLTKAWQSDMLCQAKICGIEKV